MRDQLKFSIRAVLAATLIVVTPVLAGAYWLVNAISTGQSAAQIASEFGPMMAYLAAQPVLSFWLGIICLALLAVFLASDLQLPIASLHKTNGGEQKVDGEWVGNDFVFSERRHVKTIKFEPGQLPRDPLADDPANGDENVPGAEKPLTSP